METQRQGSFPSSEEDFNVLDTPPLSDSGSRSMIFDESDPHGLGRRSANLCFQEEPEYKLGFNLIREISQHEGHSDHQKSNHIELITNRENLIVGDPFAIENCHAAKSILNLLSLRDKYMFKHCQCTCFACLL
jgi:hypothetical protein